MLIVCSVMAELAEVVITSDCNSLSGTAKVWNLRTGTSIFTLHGGGISQTRSLCLLGGNYILSSEQSKPIIHVWPANSHEPTFDLRSICSGAVNALQASSNGLWVAAAVDDKVHVWQAASGCLLGTVSGHYQAVTILKFTDDSSHLISAGEDGMVLVWSLASIVDRDASVVEPVHRLTGHHLAVRDVCVSYCGMRARLASVSIDGTCKIVDLASGKTLLNLIHDKPLTSVALKDTDLFLGDNSGSILAFSLRDPPRQVDHHLDKENLVLFQGHSKAVTSLAHSMDGWHLLSGSADECVRVWHVKSRFCVRVLEHKGPVTNLLVTMTPAQMFENKFRPNTVLKKLQRNVVAVDKDYTITVPRGLRSSWIPPLAQKELSLLQQNILEPVCQVSGFPVNETEHLNTTKLKQVNAELYDFIVKNILSRTSRDSSISNNSVNVEEAIMHVEKNLVMSRKMTAPMKKKNVEKNLAISRKMTAPMKKKKKIKNKK